MSKKKKALSAEETIAKLRLVAEAHQNGELTDKEAAREMLVLLNQSPVVSDATKAGLVGGKDN